MEANKETLEEAAEKFAINIQTKAGTMSRENAIEWFKAGAKYQAETMYSEEDLMKAWHNGMKSDNGFFGSFKEWFEQFKKK